MNHPVCKFSSSPLQLSLPCALLKFLLFFCQIFFIFVHIFCCRGTYNYFSGTDFFLPDAGRHCYETFLRKQCELPFDNADTSCFLLLFLSLFCLYVQFCIPMHCNEDVIYIFLFWEQRGLSPNFHIQVSLSDLYIPKIGLRIS